MEEALAEEVWQGSRKVVSKPCELLEPPAPAVQFAAPQPFFSVHKSNIVRAPAPVSPEPDPKPVMTCDAAGAAALRRARARDARARPRRGRDSLHRHPHSAAPLRSGDRSPRRRRHYPTTASRT